MVSSVLSPEKIVGRQNKNRAAAQNFISGGSVLGASVVNGAANKIVGFQRAGVKPTSSATGSIVSTISTNINNNVTGTVNKTLQGFSADYQKRINQVDDAKPIGILSKFLNVYKTALGFINFFGNKKNIDRLRDNLDSLKKSFTESFDVAKLIRQVIIKIVKQLSSLPVASPSGGGGLNLDVDIPGGGLKKSAPKGRLGRMVSGIGGRGKMLALGAGALGLGAAGAGVVNALSDSPQEKAQSVGASPEIPGDVVDGFSSIVDKFANAISKLFENKKQKPKQQSPGGGGDPGEGDPGKGDVDDPNAGPVPDGSPGDGVRPGGGRPGSPGDVTFKSKAGTEKGTELAQKLIAQGFTPEAAAGLAGGAQYESAGFTADEEFSPNSYGTKGRGWLQWTNPGGSSGRRSNFEKFARENKLDPKSNEANYRFLMYEMGGATGNQWSPGYNLEEFKKIKDSKKAEEYFRSGYLRPNQAKANAPERQRLTQQIYQQLQKQPQPQPPTKAQPPTKPAAKPAPAVKPVKPVKPVKAAAAPSVAAKLVASSVPKTQATQIAAAVSQPTQTKPQVNYLPIDLSGGGQKQTGGGGMSGPPPSKGSEPSVPFLPTSNPDNFLVVYSKMVYNIVT